MSLRAAAGRRGPPAAHLPDMDETATLDAEGRQPAALTLICPYCALVGLSGEIVPILEYTASYSEHRDWTGTECYTCGAEWEMYGAPRRGPHQASLDWAVEKKARQDAAEAQMDKSALAEETPR